MPINDGSDWAGRYFDLTGELFPEGSTRGEQDDLTEAAIRAMIAGGRARLEEVRLKRAAYYKKLLKLKSSKRRKL